MRGLGMPLDGPDCIRTGVKDLTALKGMKRSCFLGREIPAADISLLKDTPLQEVGISEPAKHLELLRSITTLERINGMPAAEFWENLKEK